MVQYQLFSVKYPSKRNFIIKKNIETLNKLIELLESLDEDVRQQTVNSALLYVGSTPVETPKVGGSLKGENEDEVTSSSDLSRKASDWLNRNDFTTQALEDVFHFSDGEVEVIAADLPGSSDREQTVQCYLLFGIKNFLQEGEPKVDDKQARQLCQEVGCYDSANHAKYVSSMGNQITGSKKDGFELTAPGRRAAAELIKRLTTPKS